MQSNQSRAQEKVGSPTTALTGTSSWIAILLLFSLYVCMCVFVYWGRNRGLCITDESFCLMLCKQPDHFNTSLSCFNLFASKLPRLSANIVSNFRLWHLFAQILSACVLSIAFAQIAKRFLQVDGTKFFLLAFSIAGIANLLPFSIYPLALSYNSLVSLFIYSATACTLLAAAVDEAQGRPWKSAPLLVLTGILCAFCFFVKATSAASFFALSCIFVFATKKWKLSLILCCMQALGVVIGAILFFMFFIPAPVWLTNVNTAFASSNSVDTGILSVVFRSITGSFPKMFFVIARFLVIGVITFAIAVSLRGKRRLIPSIAVSVLAMLGAQALYFNEFSPGGKSVSFFFVLILTFFWLLFARKPLYEKDEGEAINRSCIAVAVLLALLPISCAVGTGNNLFEHTAIHLAPVFLLFLLLSTLLWKRRKLLLVSVMCGTLLCTVAACQFFRGFLNTPYGLALPMKAQNQPTNLPGIKGQKLCLGGRVFLEKVNALLVAGGFKEGDTIVAFYNLPGVLLSSGGTAPGAPAFFPEPSMNGNVVKALKELAPNKRLFLLQTWTLPSEVKNAMKKQGYAFPEQFRLLGSLTNPYGDPSMFRNYPDKKFLDCKVDVYAFEANRIQPKDARLPAPERGVLRDWQ